MVFQKSEGTIVCSTTIHVTIIIIIIQTLIQSAFNFGILIFFKRLFIDFNLKLGTLLDSVLL